LSRPLHGPHKFGLRRQKRGAEQIGHRCSRGDAIPLNHHDSLDSPCRPGREQRHAGTIEFHLSGHLDAASGVWPGVLPDFLNRNPGGMIARFGECDPITDSVLRRGRLVCARVLLLGR
jgi:hypothetical protein